MLTRFLAVYQPLLDNLLLSNDDTLYNTDVTDTFSIWLQRAIQCCSDESCRLAIDSLVQDRDVAAIFDYICDFWTDSGAALANALKDLFKKTINILGKIRNQEQHVNILRGWTLKLLEFPRTMRVIYFMIEILVKHIGGQFILDNDSDFLNKSLDLMESNALSNPISRCLFAVYQSLPMSNSWGAKWVPQTRKTLLFNAASRQHILTYFLPLMFRHNPDSLKEFISPLKSKTYQDDEDALTILVRCLKIGQDFSIIKLEDGIDPSFAETLLMHGSPILRIDALSLLVTSPQGAKPVPSYVFNILRNSLDHLLVESESGYRNKIVGLIRQFVFRIRNVSYALKRDGDKISKRHSSQAAVDHFEKLQDIRQFCLFLLNFLKLQLRPGSPYHCMFSATLILNNLVQSGLDESVDSKYYEKQHIPFGFSLKIFDPPMVRLLVDNVTNNYEDIRIFSAKILVMAPISIPHLESIDSLRFLDRRANKMISGMRGREGDGGARLGELVFRLYRDNGSEFLNSLLASLEQDLIVAKKDLVAAATEYSLHGYFICLRLIIEKLDFSSVVFEKEIYNRIVACIFSSWDIVKVILCHDSPEGNLPTEFDIAPDLEVHYGPGTQLILSYSWRTIKESMVLMKSLLQYIPDKFLDDKDILLCGSLILDQLATIRHRGAFSSVYPTFVACCRRCNLRPSLLNQPETWLDDNIKLIQLKSQNITRRSGGLPYLVTAVLAASQNNNDALMKKAFYALLEIAYSPIKQSSEDNHDLPQVHAFNCIRALFIETELSRACRPFSDDALELAITFFSNSIWAIRNCAVMLYTALQNRLFDSKLNAKVSGRLFFTRHPRLRQLLLNHLEEHTFNIANDKGDIDKEVEIVYPVLSLLSKVQAVNGYRGLDGFKPLILSCLDSKVWKIREMAARVYGSVIMPQEIPIHCKELVNKMTVTRQNQLHGKCMAVYFLLDNVDMINMTDMTDILDLQKLLESKFDNFVKNNNSPQTSLAYFRIFKQYFAKSEIFCSFCLDQAQECILPLNASRRLLKAEKVSTILTKMLGEKDFDIICLQLLNSEFYEVQLEVIDFLDKSLEKLQSPILKGKLSDALFDLFVNCGWDQIRGAALHLYGKFANHTETSMEIITKRWEMLYQSLGEETTEITLACLESLGPLTGIINRSEETCRWLEKVLPYTNEEQSANIRMATLKSLCGFLVSVGNSTEIFKTLWYIYFFLSDDDADIRDYCTSFCCNYFHSNLSTSIYCENLIMQRMASMDEYVSESINFVTGGEAFKPQLVEALTPDSLLFSIEKQNLFRSDLDKLAHFQNWLIKLGDSVQKQDKVDLLQWVENGIDYLQTQKENCNLHEDGLLGWTSSSPEIYMILTRLQVAIKILYGWKVAIINLEQLRDLAKKLKFHELLIV